jgi:AcrR family transcriptional regulator
MSPKVTPEHVEARRRQILDAACEVLSRKGLRNTTMRDIFKAAGLSSGAVYSYFASKDDLIAALSLRSQERNQALLGPGEGQEPSWAQAVESLMRAVEWVAEAADEGATPNLDLEIWTEALSNARIHQSVVEAGEMIAAPFVEAIRADQARGLVQDTLDARYAGRVVLSLVVGMEVLAGLDPGFDIRRYMAALQPLLERAGWLTETGPTEDALPAATKSDSHG